MPAPTSRRQFLAQAAGVAVGGAALGMALPRPDRQTSLSESLIRSCWRSKPTRVARAACEAAIRQHSALDRDLPIEECRSSVTLWEETIGATNDPRWIDCERAVMRRMNAETDAACVLVKCPTDNDGRRRGVLRYAVEADTDGEGWPPVVESDDGQPDPGAS